MITAGLQVPAIPLLDVPGSAVGFSPKQNGPIGPKLGVTVLVTVIVLLEVNGLGLHKGAVVYAIFVKFTVVLAESGTVVNDPNPEAPILTDVATPFTVKFTTVFGVASILIVAVEPVHNVVGTLNAITAGAGRTVMGKLMGVEQILAPEPVLTLVNTNVVLAGQVAPRESEVGVIFAVPPAPMGAEPFTPFNV